jgi:hypothetical protein
MAYQGRKTFTAGEVLTASDLNSTVDQTVMVFADAAARTAAIPSPTEGMVAYLKDTNVTAYYSGSAWEPIAPSTTFTASRAIVSDGSGNLTASAVTATELGHVSGVTSAVQTQLNAKVGTVDGTVTTANTSSTVVRNITLSTSDPTGGTDGQVWLKYT